MSGLENFEISEALDSVETPSVSELQEEREQLRLEADAALQEGNVERSNYFQGEVAKLDAQLSRLEGEGAETALGEGHAAGHSESYWKEQAAKELAEHGKTTWYYDCKKRLEEAIKNDAK